MNPANLPFDSEAMLQGLKSWVECESPTWDAGAVERMLDVAARDMAIMGATIERIGGRQGFGGVIRARFPHPKQGEPGILIAGHMDTVHPVGTIEILTGSHSHGQGHETTFAQLIAERLGVPLSQVSIVHGDTDKVQFGMGTYGSRSIAVGGTAIVKAMEKVEAKAKKIASHLLEASEGDIVIENGEFKVTGTDKSIALPMVALAAYTAHNLPDGMEPGLKEGAFYDPTNFTFPAGAYICEMEVDSATGKSSFVNFVAADDFGRLINPMIVEGQVHGGLAQGIGQALLEGVVYDSSGQLVTASFMDYTMPRADDLPSFKLSHTTTLCPGNPLGVKGCGEAGAIGASAAVINAITDAIGNNKLEMPATPDRVWHAIHG